MSFGKGAHPLDQARLVGVRIAEIGARKATVNPFGELRIRDDGVYI